MKKLALTILSVAMVSTAFAGTTFGSIFGSRYTVANTHLTYSGTDKVELIEESVAIANTVGKGIFTKAQWRQLDFNADRSCGSHKLMSVKRLVRRGYIKAASTFNMQTSYDLNGNAVYTSTIKFKVPCKKR